MTSNAGAMKIVEPKNLGFATHTTDKQNYEKMKSGVMDEVKRIFKPEFLNRIDETIVFHSLTKEDMTEIITLLSQNLCNRCKEQMDITLHISKSAKLRLVEKHMDLKMGARPLKRAIQTQIEDKLAEEILAGRIKNGDEVTAGVRKEQFVFTTR